MRGRIGKDTVTGLVMLGAGEEAMHTRGEEDSLPPHDLPQGITLDHTINVYLWECGICGSINKFIKYKYKDVKKTFMHPQPPHFHVYSLMSVQDILVSGDGRPFLR